MSRNRSLPPTFGLAVLGFALGLSLASAAPPPEKLPLLPPPGKAADPKDVKPPEPKAPAPKAPAPKADMLRVPVEFKIAIADLEKQMLRNLVEKIDPAAKPVLPVVVKANERGLALAGDRLQMPAPLIPQPVPVVPPGVRPERPLLIPRKPGERPFLDRLGERPLVANVAGRLAERLDFAYRIELRSFRVSVSGNTLTAEVGGGLYFEGRDPQSVRDLPLKLTLSRDLVWAENGKLELTQGATRVEIDRAAEIVGFPRLDVRRLAMLNGLLGLVNGAVDRELTKRLPTEHLPDLNTIGPKLREKLPALALAEITAFPVRGDEKDLAIALVVGLVPANKKNGDAVKIYTDAGPAPAPTIRGRIVLSADGKPDVKLEAAP